MNWKQEVDTFLATIDQPLLVVVGPTASGKTGFSIELAKHIGKSAEIVNADSRQLFTRMDIGTAKITEQEMQGVPHHLFDVLRPETEATAGWFQKKSREKMQELWSREKVPILVGGSMLYVSTIIDNLTLAGPMNPKIRKRLEQEYAQDSGEAMLKRLTELDPVAASKLHQNNMPRLVRALEIYEISQKSKTDTVSVDELRSGEEVSEHMKIFGITRPREELNDRIIKRLDIMFEQGWIEEVQALLDAGYTKSDPGMKSHGYKEIMEYLLDGNPNSIEELKLLIAKKTKAYAKRQVGWWKNDSRILWI